MKFRFLDSMLPSIMGRFKMFWSIYKVCIDAKMTNISFDFSF